MQYFTKEHASRRPRDYFDSTQYKSRVIAGGKCMGLLSREATVFNCRPVTDNLQCLVTVCWL